MDERADTTLPHRRATVFAGSRSGYWHVLASQLAADTRRRDVDPLSESNPVGREDGVTPLA